MKKIKIASLFVCLTLIFSACGNSTGNGALIGTGGGALLGAIVGKLAGNTAVGAAVGAATGAAIGKHMDKVKAETAAQLANAQVEEVKDANGLTAVKVTFDNGILFKVGKSDLQATAQTELLKFANVLKNNTDCNVAVQGYASSDGAEDVNLRLSQNRANAVTNYLTTTCGVAASQITSTTGYGETNLVMKADGTEDMAASRRVEVYLYASQSMINAANNGSLN